MLRVKLQMQTSHARSRRLKIMQRDRKIAVANKKADTAMSKAQTALD
jgi:hypothetical protein